MRLQRLLQIGLPVLFGLALSTTSRAEDTYRLDGKRMPSALGGITAGTDFVPDNGRDARDADTQAVFHRRRGFYGGGYQSYYGGGYQSYFGGYQGGFSYYRPSFNYYPSYGFQPLYNYSFAYSRPFYQHGFYGSYGGFGGHYYGISDYNDCDETLNAPQTLGYSQPQAMAQAQPYAQPYLQPRPSVQEHSSPLPVPQQLQQPQQPQYQPPVQAQPQPQAQSYYQPRQAVRGMPQSYPYDGGPTNPVPMPRDDGTRPNPNPTKARPQPINPADGRLVSLTANAPKTAPAKLRYLAYGEKVVKPAAAPITPSAMTPETFPVKSSKPSMVGGFLNVNYVPASRSTIR